MDFCQFVLSIIAVRDLMLFDLGLRRFCFLGYFCCPCRPSKSVIAGVSVVLRFLLIAGFLRIGHLYQAVLVIVLILRLKRLGSVCFVRFRNGH